MKEREGGRYSRGNFVSCQNVISRCVDCLANDNENESVIRQQEGEEIGGGEGRRGEGKGRKGKREG